MGSVFVVFMWVLMFVFSWVVLAVLGRVPARGATTDRRDAGKRSPPGPRPLPLIGNLLHLGDGQPHRTLAGLARVHGPLMSFRLGRVPAVVVSSPTVAKQVLHTHDKVLSSRAVPDAVRALHHNEVSMVWMPPDGAWRLLRRLCNAHLFTTQRLDANQHLRSRKVRELVSFVGQCARAGCAVDVGRTALTATLNLVSNTLFSADVVDYNSESSAEFKDLIRGIMEKAGAPNVVDYFPLLRWADPQGRRQQLALYFRRLHKLFDSMIDGRLKSRPAEAGAEAEDFLDVLLDSLASSELDRRIINALLLDLFVAGSDTSSTTVEWAMAELLRNPTAMARALSELEEAMKGSRREAVEESDLSRLPYLQAVFKETLRLHPPVALLLPRRVGAAVEISTTPTHAGEGMTYTVPEGATVLVNAWAIGRDPEAWGPKADTFQPERFLEAGGGAAADVGFKGLDMKLIPFGAGRRICPGIPLAARMAPLMLANLLWSFKWELPEGMALGEVDMTERFGITLCMAKPLLAVVHACGPRWRSLRNGVPPKFIIFLCCRILSCQVFLYYWMEFKGNIDYLLFEKSFRGC